MTLNRLDRDIEILFEDLGKSNERSTENLRLRVKNGTMSTNEKIKRNTEGLGISYRSLDERLN